MTRKATKPTTTDLQASLDHTEGDVSELQGEVREYQEEVRELRKVVARLDGFREGTFSVGRLVGVIITIIAAAGLCQFVTGNIQENVSVAVGTAVGEEVVGALTELGDGLDAVNDAASRAEVAVGRAESASSNADSAAATAEAGLSAMFVLATQITISESAGEWIVAIGAVETLEEAIGEADRAIRAGYVPVTYYFDDLFVVSIGPYETEEKAQLAKQAVRSTLKGSPEVYDLRHACPYREFNTPSAYFHCYLEPTPVPSD